MDTTTDRFRRLYPDPRRLLAQPTLTTGCMIALAFWLGGQEAWLTDDRHQALIDRPIESLEPIAESIGYFRRLASDGRTVWVPRHREAISRAIDGSHGGPK